MSFVNLLRFACALTILGWIPIGSAQPYPAKPVRLVVPFTPGSASDILARAVSQRLSAKWGQPVVVDNRPGAGGTIGTALVARSTADGHTLVVVSAGHVVNPVIYGNLSYDTLRDFSGVIPLANLPSVLAVSRDTRVSTVREFINLAKTRREGLNFVTGGVGSGSHVNAEKFRIAAGISATHIPMKGAADMLTEIMSGRVQYGFLPIIAAVSAVKEGRVRALAVSSDRRSSALPDVPTIVEAGLPDARFDFWIGLLAPAGVPRPVVQKLNTDIARLLSLPEVEQRLAGLGAIPMPMSPENFDAFMRKEATELGALMRTAGVKSN
ncbi:MAG: Bug family tripartite tricarboxylate transporter substrate binding protein [Burkholderiales bacterium]